MVLAAMPLSAMTQPVDGEQDQRPTRSPARGRGGQEQTPKSIDGAEHQPRLGGTAVADAGHEERRRRGADPDRGDQRRRSPRRRRRARRARTPASSA